MRRVPALAALLLCERAPPTSRPHLVAIACFRIWRLALRDISYRPGRLTLSSLRWSCLRLRDGPLRAHEPGLLRGRTGIMHAHGHGRGRDAGPSARLLTLLGKRCDKAHTTAAELDSQYLSMVR